MCVDQNILELLDHIAAELILSSPDDLPVLVKLQDSFISLADAAGEKSPQASSVARNCAGRVERIILRETDNAETALSALNDAVTTLQALLRDRRNPDEITYPPGFNPSEIAAEHAQDSSDDSVSPPTPSATGENSVTDNALMMITLDTGDNTLVAEFISEAEDHCATAEQMLMSLETDEDNRSAIDAIFRSFHTIKGAAGFLELKPISLLAHESETLLDLARKGAVVIAGRVADAIFDSIDVLRALFKGTEEVLKNGGTFDGSEIIPALIEKLRDLINATEQADEAEKIEPSDRDVPQRVGDILVDSGAVTQHDINKALKSKKSPEEKIGETLVRQGMVSGKAVVHALREQKQKRSATMVKDVVRIDTERLDRLVDTIGELVIAESMVGQDEDIMALASTKVSKNISHLNKITRELQEMGMAMRLVPVQATFHKLARAVRDLARKSNKPVNLEVSGEDAEVDRSIAENIGDPLMHMVRNSVDHGLEAPDERVSLGKPEAGTIWIRAYHKGGNIYLEIEDDGRGLNREKILAKAQEKGLLPSGRELSEREILNLIMMPGFSTASKITDISGRGVGMDVVKKNIDAMRGHLEIESEPGQGTKFSIRLPLTLAIIDGMLVGVGEEQLIIPTLSVIKSLPLTPDMIHTIRNRHEMITLRGEVIPLYRIRQLFGLPPSIAVNADSTVVIVDDMERKLGLVVDHLYGQRQTVIKSLGTLFQNQKWVAGGAILTNGNVGLIIDISSISEMARMFDFEPEARTLLQETRTNSGATPDTVEEIGQSLAKTDEINNIEPILQTIQ